MTDTRTNLPWLRELFVAAKQATDKTSNINHPYVPPKASVAFEPPPHSESVPDAAKTAKDIGLFVSMKWGVLGFVAGIAFWNIVSFWSFVGEAVFTGPRDPSAYELALRDSAVNIAIPRKDISSITPDENAAREEALSTCIALEIDRKGKQTYSKPCRRSERISPKNGQRRTVVRTGKF